MADEVLAADLEALVARVAAEQDDGRAEGDGLAATAREGAVGARVEGYASEARAAEVALAGLEALVARVAAAEDDAEAAYALQEVESGGRERAVARDAVAREDEAETEIGGFAAGMLARLDAAVEARLMAGSVGAGGDVGGAQRGSGDFGSGDDPLAVAAAADAAEALLSALRRASADADALPPPAAPAPAMPPLLAFALPSVEPREPPEPEDPRPRQSDVAPPASAREFYKVVAVQGGGHGGDHRPERFVSVYDGVTEYRLGETVRSALSSSHGGGLYVSRTIAECVSRDADGFPASSALVDAARRAILRVVAWNSDAAQPPVRYGRKLAFEFVQPVETLPYPSTWRPGYYDRAAAPVPVRLSANEEAEGVLRPRTQIRLEEAAAAQGGAQQRRVRLLAAQAATVALEEDVRRLERRREAAQNAPPMPEWVGID